jgi:hypothetical protein
VASGHRLIFGCSHNAMIDGGRLVRSPAIPPTSQVTNSGWSINDAWVALVSPMTQEARVDKPCTLKSG